MSLKLFGFAETIVIAVRKHLPPAAHCVNATCSYIRRLCTYGIDLKYKSPVSSPLTTWRGHRNSEGCKLWVLWGEDLGDLFFPSSSSSSFCSSCPLMIRVNILYINSWAKADVGALWRNRHLFSFSQGQPHHCKQAKLMLQRERHELLKVLQNTKQVKQKTKQVTSISRSRAGWEKGRDLQRANEEDSRVN